MKSIHAMKIALNSKLPLRFGFIVFAMAFSAGTMNADPDGIRTAGVTIAEADYDGRAQFKIVTPGATWFYDKTGGGFSRLIDADGRDWIAFKKLPVAKTPESAAGDYRGIPNLVYGKQNPEAGTGHPGFDLCETELVAPDILRTRSKSGTWQWTWRFTATSAIFTMERADPVHPWWFLYEGPIAGRFAPREQYWGTDQGGPRRETPAHMKGESLRGRWSWVYFGDRRSSRVLFLAQLGEPDELDEIFGYMGNTTADNDSPDGMVVFGFGRHAKPLFAGAGLSFVVGLIDQSVAAPADHQQVAEAIERQLEEANQ